MASYPIVVHTIASRRFDRAYRFREHVHVCQQCYTVLEGAIDYRIEGRTHRLVAGQAMLVGAGLRREPRAASATGRVCIASFFSPWPELGRPHGVLARLDATTRAESELLAAVAGQTGQVASIRLHRVLLGILGDDWFARLDRVPADERTRDETRLVERLEEILAANLGRPFVLAEMAALAGTSPARLGRLFRRHRGCAPVARHRELRLQAALRRLRDGRTPVTSVAMETGFASSQHLATAFGRRFGVPPSRTAELPDQPMYAR